MENEISEELNKDAKIKRKDVIANEYRSLKSMSQYKFTSKEDRFVWSYLFSTAEIGDFQVTVPQNVQEEFGWSYTRTK